MLDDADILAARAVGLLGAERRTGRYERVRQDGKIYYRLLTHDGGGGSLTDAEHARLTITFWREKGWLIDASNVDGYCSKTCEKIEQS
jgi:hypothetical protein